MINPIKSNLNLLHILRAALQSNLLYLLESARSIAIDERSLDISSDRWPAQGKPTLSAPRRRRHLEPGSGVRGWRSCSLARGARPARTGEPARRCSGEPTCPGSWPTVSP